MRFRFWRREAWGFKSLHPHHKTKIQTNQSLIHSLHSAFRPPWFVSFSESQKKSQKFVYALFFRSMDSRAAIARFAFAIRRTLFV